MTMAAPDFELRDRLPPLGWTGKLVGALWACAEATVFFVVPDVWLTVVGLRNGTYPALVAALFVTLGGVAGGLALYFYSAADPVGARNLLLTLPAVNVETLREARALLARWDAIAVIGSPYSLLPFKAMAVEAPAAAVQPLYFGLAAFFAYLSRAFLVALVAGFAGWLFRRTLGLRRMTIWALGLWAGIYVLFFARFYV